MASVCRVGQMKRHYLEILPLRRMLPAFHFGCLTCNKTTQLMLGVMLCGNCLHLGLYSCKRICLSEGFYARCFDEAQFSIEIGRLYRIIIAWNQCVFYLVIHQD